jgi:hypothetical protein
MLAGKIDGCSVLTVDISAHSGRYERLVEETDATRRRGDDECGRERTSAGVGLRKR